MPLEKCERRAPGSTGYAPRNTERPAKAARRSYTTVPARPQVGCSPADWRALFAGWFNIPVPAAPLTFDAPVRLAYDELPEDVISFARAAAIRRQQIERTIMLLAQAFPRAFAQPRPLKIGVRRDLDRRALMVTARRVDQALKHWTGSDAYQEKLHAGAPRIDLDGEACGAVSQAQADYAARRLAAMQARIGKVRP
jgi:ProQ/FINO family